MNGERVHYACGWDEWHALRRWARRMKQASLTRWLEQRPGSVWSEGAD